MTTIIKIALKYWYLVLIAIAVLLYVPGLFFSDLAFFGQKAPAKIASTPIVVDEIREIGELVTSEYYGEIYADLYEAYQIELDKFEPRFEIVKDSLFRIYPKLESFAKVYYNYKKAKLAFETAKATYEKIKTETGANERDGEKALREFQKTEAEYRTLEIKHLQAAKERNLVYIGRGWVKAGFDFGTFNSDLLILRNESDTLHLQLPKPKLLNADINPWFIESKKIKGYEVFMKNGNQYTNEEIALVKDLCKQKLRKDAMDKGILEKAAESGKAALENLFSLLKAKTVRIRFE
ncbi:MAG TPA: hypothetical protein DCQ31_12495 [Bacteroidales bacterium]|nr:hypothetical protein [Bacteroidales bacterium]